MCDDIGGAENAGLPTYRLLVDAKRAIVYCGATQATHVEDQSSHMTIHLRLPGTITVRAFFSGMYRCILC